MHPTIPKFPQKLCWHWNPHCPWTLSYLKVEKRPQAQEPELGVGPVRVIEGCSDWVAAPPGVLEG